MPIAKFVKKLIAHPLIFLPLIFIAAGLFGGCASNMERYYSDLRAKLEARDYSQAADFVERSRGKYGSKNILLFYYDSGFVNHLAENNGLSFRRFETAKVIYNDNFTRSISAGVASMFLNDNAIPYYGLPFERAHVSVFQALNLLTSGQDIEATVEARQTDTLFRILSFTGDFYNEDAFIRYFMGMVFENAGEFNDARVSYTRAITAYEMGFVGLEPPRDLINDAYTLSLRVGFPERAQQIKARYPFATRTEIPAGFGECVIVNYNGFIPEKVEQSFEFALFDLWPYVGATPPANSREERDMQRAKSITIAAFANDFVRIAFPVNRRIPNAITTFAVTTSTGAVFRADKVQDIAVISDKVLQDNIGKIRAKTFARAAIRYVLGKTTSRAVRNSTNNDGLGALTQIAFNIFSAAVETADTRGWNTLPEEINISRFYLPAGNNRVIVSFLDRRGRIVEERVVNINIREGRKNFVYLRSSFTPAGR